MPQFGASNFNLVDEANSSDVLLGISGVFTGTFTDVSGYTTITVHLAADEIIDSAEIQWSEDGIIIKDTTTFFAGFNPSTILGSGGAVATHIPIKSRFYRIRVVNNNFAAQTTFMLQTQVVRGPKSGDVQPVVLFPTDGDSGMLTKSVLFARRNETNLPAYTQVLSDGNGYLAVTTTPRSLGNVPFIVPASLVSTSLTSTFFDATRDEFTVVNDTTRGTLYIRCFGGAASVNDYHYKVPSQHTFTLPYSWRFYGGPIHGIWDTADGFAYCREVS